MMFPKALIAMRMFRPFTPLLLPNTAVKNRLATVRSDTATLSLGTFRTNPRQRISAGHVPGAYWLTGCEVCNVASYIKNSHDQKGHRSRPPQYWNGILPLSEFHSKPTGANLHTFISLTTLNAFVYPAYAKLIFTNAFAIPFPLLVVPANEFRKLAYGSFTRVWPPSTTHPVIVMLPTGKPI